MPRLPVKDLHAAIDFYTSTLGFAAGPLWPEDAPSFVLLDRDDVCVQFYLADSAHGEVAGHGTLSFDVDDANALHGQLAGHVTIEWGPEVYWYGAVSLRFEIRKDISSSSRSRLRIAQPARTRRASMSDLPSLNHRGAPPQRPVDHRRASAPATA